MRGKVISMIINMQIKIACYNVFMGCSGCNRKERIKFINKDKIGFRKGRE